MWCSPSSHDDSWAIFSLGAAVHGGVDLRFVQSISRPFIFSVDSFSLPITRLVSDPVPRPGDSTLIGLIGDGQLDKLGLKGIHTDRELAVATAAVPITCHLGAPARGKRSRAAPPAAAPPAGDGVGASNAASPSDPEDQEVRPYLLNRVSLTCFTALHRACWCSFLVLTIRCDGQFSRLQALTDERARVQVLRALKDLEKRHIGVDSEDEMAMVRGGGLLKYASYLTKGFRLRPGINKSRLVRCRDLDAPPTCTRNPPAFWNLLGLGFKTQKDGVP